MSTNLHINTKKRTRISKHKIKNVDWDLVNDFKEGLDELKKGNVIKC